MQLPKILFIVDIENWAYDYRAKIWKHKLRNMYNIDILYLSKYTISSTPLFDYTKYDGIVFFYYKAILSAILKNTPIDRNKTAICINNGKWKIPGAKLTYNTYMKDIKLIIACNDYILDCFSAYTPRITKVTQAVDQTIFNVSRDHIISKNSGSDIVVGWCGNSSNPLKTINILQQACKYAKVQLYIATNLNQSQLNTWYNTIDIAICSNYSPEGEGGPNMLLEAGACMIPYITSPTGLAKEIIRNNYNGIIVKDPKQLGATIYAVSKDPKLRESLARRLNSDILKSWTYDARLYEIDLALHQLIGQ